MFRPVAVVALILSSFGAGIISAQTVIWQETFDGTGNWGTLNQSAGAEGCNANPFYISCQENGNAAGVCGSACGSNNTLHVGSIAYGDIGAAYDAGGGSACGGVIACIFGGLCNTLTNRRSSSGTINTIGFTGINLEFDYIEAGSGSADNAYAEYSTNNGSTWNWLHDMPKTNNSGCGGQGRWTHISIPLPSACDNISTLRIAFRWRNNNDAGGTDPSFAVNDVQVTQPFVLPVELVSFSGKRVGKKNVLLEWMTATETNNEGFELWRRIEQEAFKKIAWVQGAVNSNETIQYSFEDAAASGRTSYYYLRQIDLDGNSELSEVISVQALGSSTELLIYPNPARNNVFIEGAQNGAEYVILDVGGRVLQSGTMKEGRLDISDLKNGLYNFGIEMGGQIKWQRSHVHR